MNDDEQDYRDHWLYRYSNITVPLIALLSAAAIGLTGWWTIKIGMHLYQTGNLWKPAIRIVKTETHKPMIDMENNSTIILDPNFSTSYEVQYKTLDDGYWKSVCYKYCSLDSLDEANDEAARAEFLIKKHGTPYSLEYPRFGKIETEVVIPYKGEK